MARKKVWTKTPVLKPGVYTADQVLAKVERIIEKEPKRLRMDTWVSMWKGQAYWTRVNRPPACGTVMCVGGWINTLTNNLEDERPRYEGAPLELSSYSGYDALTKLKVEGTPVGEALNNLFSQTDSTSRQVLKELARIRQEYKTELQAAQVVVE